MSKRTAGIVRGKWSFNERQYYLEGLNYYDEILYIDPLHVTYCLDREAGTVNVDYNGYRLNHLSMLYTFGRAEETLLLVKSLIMCGCPISDPYNTISRESLGKITDSLSMFEVGSGTTAHILTTLEMSERYLEGLGSEHFPLLNKPTSGNQGKGIVPLHTREEAQNFCRTHFKKRDRFLYFEKLMNYVHEYRIYLIDGKIIEAYEKVSESEGLALNLHQGAKSQLIEDSHKQKIFEYVRLHLPEKYHVGVYGLDLAETDTGDFHIIEINRTPGFGGLRSLNLVNFPKKVHEMLVSRARQVPCEKRPEHEFTLTLLGDTNPGETYQIANEAKGLDNILTMRGYDHAFQPFYDFLIESDCTIANFEACITDVRESPLEGIKPYLDWTDTDKAPSLMKKYQFSAVNLANNHTMDFGREGLKETLDILRENNVVSFGAGLSEKQAQTAYHNSLQLGDRKEHIIIASGFEYRKNHEDWKYYARKESAGVNSWARAAAKAQITQLRQENPEAFIIAFPHWGSNYLYVNERQQRLGREIIDAGADIIIGHGSHMMQEIENYRGRWIVYGIGNFIFNSPGRYRNFDVLPFGLIPKLTFYHQENELRVTVRLYPIHIDNRKTDYRTQFVSEEQFRKIVGFFMPHRKVKTGLEKHFRIGRDNHGYYLSFDYNRQVV